ncbi:HepT-like ribonuclease domain-containing protein [Bifidobacterium callitrichos]|nr:HepT-like ribonuclease domain-containing protein [Bifidobacterium callitrichos]
MMPPQPQHGHHHNEHRHDDQLFRDQTTLVRLLEHLDHAVEDASATHSPDDLFADRVRFNSVAMEMTQAQECARRLSEDYRRIMPNLPWAELRALRNALVHDYDEIDVESLYDTVTQDVPALATRLRPVVEAILHET